LYQDLPLCQAMGDAGFARAEKLYSRAAIYETLSDLYQRAKKQYE
jgi:hypothetical protein